MAFTFLTQHALDTLGPKLISELMAFKAKEIKSDPERRHGLHGPYEEMFRLKNGRLPPDYYQEGDPEPWGLRIENSRSNILWQVTSGMIDRHPEFAAAYMGLALTQSLTVDEYARELSSLHRDWGKFLQHANYFNDHAHQSAQISMMRTYKSVACPACSLLTAAACADPGMLALFKEMQPLQGAERRFFLQQRGLMPLLTTMIPPQDLPTNGGPLV